MDDGAPGHPANHRRRDIQVLKTYGAAPYAAELKKLEKEIKDKQQSVNEKIGMSRNHLKHEVPR